jgi:hypothetical protein
VKLNLIFPSTEIFVQYLFIYVYFFKPVSSYDTLVFRVNRLIFFCLGCLPFTSKCVAMPLDPQSQEILLRLPGDT